jgi:hypothetical protein
MEYSNRDNSTALIICKQRIANAEWKASGQISWSLWKANATAFLQWRSWLRGADLNRRPLGYAI